MGIIGCHVNEDITSDGRGHQMESVRQTGRVLGGRLTPFWS
jgi:hypothetical protein